MTISSRLSYRLLITRKYSKAFFFKSCLDSRVVYVIWQLKTFNACYHFKAEITKALGEFQEYLPTQVIREYCCRESRLDICHYQREIMPSCNTNNFFDILGCCNWWIYLLCRQFASLNRVLTYKANVVDQYVTRLFGVYLVISANDGGREPLSISWSISCVDLSDESIILMSDFAIAYRLVASIHHSFLSRLGEYWTLSLSKSPVNATTSSFIYR